MNAINPLSFPKSAHIGWDGTLQKKSLLVAGSVLFLAIAAAASATPVDVSVSGQFTSGVTADSLAAPGEIWALSFDVDSNPAAGNSDALGFDAPFTNFTYTLGGSSVAVTPASIRFYTGAGGGFFTVFFGPESGFNNGQPIPEFSFSGAQIFSGTTTAPVISPGTYPIADALYSDALNYDDEGASGSVIVGGSSVTPPIITPEPSTWWLVFAGCLLLGLGFPNHLWKTVCTVAGRAVAHCSVGGSRNRRSDGFRTRLYHYSFLCISLLSFLSIFSKPAKADWTSGLLSYSDVESGCRYQYSTVLSDVSGQWLGLNIGVDSYGRTVAHCTGTVKLQLIGVTPFDVPLYPFCAVGLIADGSEPGGCAPNNGAQPPKQTGGSKKTHSPMPAYTSDRCVKCSPVDSTKTINLLGEGKGGDPIDIGSGNVFYETTDYTTAGQNPLQFIRYYNSRGAFLGMLGLNWRSQFEANLIIVSSTKFIAQRPDGQQLTFNYAGNQTWTSDSDVDYTVTNNGPVFTLIGPDDTVETYTNNASDTFSVLNSIRARNGYTQTLNYANGFLSSVTDSYNRTLTFTTNNAGTLQSVLTPDGTTINYGYNVPSVGGLLTSAIFPTSPSATVTYSYGAPSGIHPLDSATLTTASLRSIIDENGQPYLSWTYDAYGRGLTSSMGSSGLDANRTTVSYDDDAITRTVTNALGVSDTYSFYILQNLFKVKSVSRAATATTAAGTKSFTFDGNGYMASMTDWNGNLTTFVNNSHGAPIAINEALGSSVARTTSIAYDPTWVHLPKLITTPGLTASFTYDSGGEQLTQTLTDTTTMNVPYSTTGQTRTWTNTWANYLLASTTSPNGNTTSMSYDSTGALIRVTNALGQVTQITSHTGGGLPESIVDPNGVNGTLTYDPRQRLLTTSIATSQGPRTTTYGYDSAGNLIKTTLPDGSALSNSYDSAHRLTTITDLFHQSVGYTLDALGDQIQTNLMNASRRIQRQHSDSFDALTRVLTDTGGMGQQTKATYDPNGNALTVTNPLGRMTTQVFDALNRLSKVTDANNGATSATYDSHDRPLTVTDANGNTTTFVYNGFGDVIQQLSPDSGKTIYQYDADANLTSKTDARGVVVNNSFDALDRILTTTYPSDPSENVAYKYDQPGHGFGIGRLTSLTDAAGSLSRTYDERGNRLTDTRVNGATTLQTTYAFDAANRIASMAYPSGWTVSYTRDIMGRIWQIPLTTPGGAGAGNAITNATYEPFGPLYTLTFGNGVNESRGFDLDYRVTNLTESGTASLQNLGYTYDADDNVAAITDAVTPTNTQTLGYDVLDRLTSGSGSYGALAYTYDSVGNRLQQTLAGATTTYSYSTGTNRLSGITAASVTTPVTYTAAGNITSIPTPSAAVATIIYNAANRLNTVTGTALAITGTLYDAFGQRFSKASGGSQTLFTYGQDGTLAEESQGGVATDYVYLNGRPVAIIAASTGKVYFLHDDRLGTPQLATEGGQNAVWRAQYQPFGTDTLLTASITDNLRLPGQYYDGEYSGHQNGFRDYSPMLGRYLETDPIGWVAGPNTYLYASANPLLNIDPTGKDVLGAGVGAFFGLVSGAFGAAAVPGATGYDIFWGGAFGSLTGLTIGFLDPVPPLSRGSIAAIAGLTGAAGDCVGQLIGGAKKINWGEVIGAGAGSFLGSGIGSIAATGIAATGGGELSSLILGNLYGLPFTVFGAASGQAVTSSPTPPQTEDGFWSCVSGSGPIARVCTRPAN